MATGVGQHGRWTLDASEIGLSVRSPYDEQSVRRQIGVSTEAFGGMHRGQELSRSSPNAPEKLSVASEFRAETSDEDLTIIERDLIRMTEVDTELRRRPLLSFTWGHITISPARLDSLSLEWVDGVHDNTGLPRALMVSLTVARAGGLVLERTSRFDRETSYHTLGAGETFEWLAWKRTGDPAKGEVYRRTNPDISVYGEAAGDVVRLLDASHSAMRQGLGMRSPFLVVGARDAINGMYPELSPEGPGLLASALELGVDAE